MLDPKKIREELIIFNPAQVVTTTIDNNSNNNSNNNSSQQSEQQPMINVQHRYELLPLLIRLTYGRSVSKSSGTKAREQNLARYNDCQFIIVYYILY